jgi:hypothetical protein
MQRIVEHYRQIITSEQIDNPKTNSHRPMIRDVTYRESHTRDGLDERLENRSFE